MGGLQAVESLIKIAPKGTLHSGQSNPTGRQVIQGDGKDGQTRGKYSLEFKTEWVKRRDGDHVSAVTVKI